MKNSNTRTNQAQQLFKFIIAPLLAAIFLVVNITPANAKAPVPGSSCPKVNQTVTENKLKYTCVKYAGKLIWGRGVSTAPAKPSPAATPSVQLSEITLANTDAIRAGNPFPWAPEGRVITAGVSARATKGIKSVTFTIGGVLGPVVTTVEGHLKSAKSDVWEASIPVPPKLDYTPQFMITANGLSNDGKKLSSSDKLTFINVADSAPTP
jgi:hypothetical protein